MALAAANACREGEIFGPSSFSEGGIDSWGGLGAVEVDTCWNGGAEVASVLRQFGKDRTVDVGHLVRQAFGNAILEVGNLGASVGRRAAEHRNVSLAIRCQELCMKLHY